MAVMTMATAKLYGRIIHVTVHVSGGPITFKNSELEIRFEVDFDDDAKPNSNFAQIYNLTHDTISRFAKGQTISISAGYKSDYGLLSSGKITSITTKYDGVDKITTLKFKEGVDYSGTKVTAAVADAAKKYYVKKRYKLKKPVSTAHVTKYKRKVKVTKRVNGKKVTTYEYRTYTRYTTSTTKYKTVKVAKWRKQTMVITFKKGIHARQIISKLTSILGIHLAELNLPRDKVYTSGYRVTGKIEDDLEKVVADCDAAMYWRRGKMVIRSIETGNDERFELSEDTGLINPPEQLDDDDIKGWSVDCLLQHRITTASIITLKSSTANGIYRVRDGKHYCDGSDFFTEFECVSSGE
jgi:hypothetical protein